MLGKNNSEQSGGIVLALTQPGNVTGSHPPQGQRLCSVGHQQIVQDIVQDAASVVARSAWD